MRITLEATDLIGILEKHLETALDPAQVIVRSDPFEVEVSGIPFVSAPEPAHAVEVRYTPVVYAGQEDEDETPPRYLPGALKDPPPPGLDTRAFSPHEFIVASQRLAAELDAERASAQPPEDTE